MKNIIQLNIGLNDTDNQPINVHTACIAAGNYGLDILASHVFDSPAGNEKTLVISAIFNKLEENFHLNIYTLAEALRQDCIAVYHGGKGELIGPNAETWGEFNPAFFVGLSGLTLAEVDSPKQELTLTSEVKRDGFTCFEFTHYLTNQLIPDLKAAGFEATAKDFETAVQFIISID